MSKASPTPPSAASVGSERPERPQIEPPPTRRQLFRRTLRELWLELVVMVAAVVAANYITSPPFNVASKETLVAALSAEATVAGIVVATFAIGLSLLAAVRPMVASSSDSYRDAWNAQVPVLGLVISCLLLPLIGISVVEVAPRIAASLGWLTGAYLLLSVRRVVLVMQNASLAHQGGAGDGVYELEVEYEWKLTKLLEMKLELADELAKRERLLAKVQELKAEQQRREELRRQGEGGTSPTDHEQQDADE